MTQSITLENAGIDFEEGRFSYSLSLDSPGVVAVTGPSGAGKSTLFHLIAGFLAPQFGRVMLNGSEMSGISPGDRPLTYIFQDHNLFAHLDIHTNVALGLSPSLRLTEADRSAVAHALDRVGLAGFERRMPGLLSGGERQRVAFARALVRRRPILLLDEAFASLDEVLRQAMGEMLLELQADHRMLVLMISHDKREIARLADRVVVVRQGHVDSISDIAAWQSQSE